MFGKPIHLEHPIYRGGTLYFEKGKGLIITQQHFDAKTKNCFWDYVDYWIANDIYTSSKFYDFFDANATVTNFPVFELRKVMWELRMKPLKKEAWETFFT